MKLSMLFLGAAFGWVFWAIVALVKNILSNQKEIGKSVGKVSDGPPKVTVGLLTLCFGAAGLGTVAWILISFGY